MFFRKIKRLRAIYRFVGELYNKQNTVFKLREKYSNAVIDITARFEIENLEKLILGNYVYIAAYNYICIGNDHISNYKESSLEIGDKTYIGEFCNIRAGGGKISIGSNCLIAQNVSLIASNHSIKKSQLISEQPWSTLNNFILIEDDVWIGCGVQILPGVKVGKGAVVAAGSVVTKNVEQYSIVGGIPAKKIGERD